MFKQETNCYEVIATKEFEGAIVRIYQLKNIENIHHRAASILTVATAPKAIRVFFIITPLFLFNFSSCCFVVIFFFVEYEFLF